MSMKTLSETLNKILNLHYEIKLNVGLKDVCNNYGWHSCYFITIYKTIEYCVKCRKNVNKDYCDDGHPLTNHRWNTESITIHSKWYDFEDEMINDLNNIFFNNSDGKQNTGKDQSTL